jgi:hypothetical protein
MRYCSASLAVSFEALLPPICDSWRQEAFVARLTERRLLRAPAAPKFLL